MDMKQSTIEQQRLDQARLEANGMYSFNLESDRCVACSPLFIKRKFMILSTMVCAFWSAWNIVVVPVPIRTQGMVPVF